MSELENIEGLFLKHEKTLELRGQGLKLFQTTPDFN